ncbi:MAG: hypothetical protein ABH817_01100, partial [archaeon]
MIKKVFACFAIVMLLSMIFNVGLFTPVKAEEIGCCVNKGGGVWCEDETLRSQCQGMFFTGKDCANPAISECKLGICLPKVTRIENIQELLLIKPQFNKHQADCQNNGGAFTTDPSYVEEGCCMIPGQIVGRVCTTLSSFVCEEIARRDGGNFTFQEGVVGESCYAVCASDKLGCCVLGGGECSRVTRGECSSEIFYEDEPHNPTYCSEIGSPQCLVETHASDGCCNPLTVGDREIKRAVCSFDSQGNQESVLEDCNYPNGKCEICMEDECERGNTLEFGIAPPA